jgi:hypothetical protein
LAFKVITFDVAWHGYMRRAKKAFPNEYVEALWGVPTVDSFRITDFVKLRAIGSKNHIECYDDSTEIKRQILEAKAAGKEFLGTIHTHPSKAFDTAASTTDHHSAVQDGERIMGVVVLHKKGRRFISEVEWWFPQPKIEFELLSE